MSPIIAASRALAEQHFRAMESGDAVLARTAVHPQHINHEAPDHPPASAQPGVPGFLATSAWLRLAFAELRFTVLDLLSDGERTVAHVTMSGRQTGPFVLFPPGGRPVSFPPTGRAFEVPQCHLFRIADGLHSEHAAVRDDLGMMSQLGHLPPSPATLARIFRWRAGGGHRRAVRRAVDVTAAAAASTTGAPPGGEAASR